MADTTHEAAGHAPLFSPGDLGHFIRTERRRQGITQAVLAARLGVSRKWLSEAENGKPTIEVGLAMAALRELGHMLRAAPRPEPEFDIDAYLEALSRRD
ncbi:helix-turn-helix domain-containing protein [Candidatus Poriferisocius sp.]|uniref:helix-turn-helix domain-containing protein n=1 Tax=Candidatus Poriferisocius sp. TaxID=3101276 RepID=UPI003B01530D